MPDVTTGIHCWSVGEESIRVMYAIISEGLGTSLGFARVAFRTHSKTHYNEKQRQMSGHKHFWSGID